MPRKKSPLNVKRDEIRKWFDDHCDINIHAHRAAIKRAAEMIFRRQTPDEQDTGETRWDNGVGFGAFDSDFGSRIAKWDGDITLKMAKGAKSMMKKYALQLAQIALE